VGSDSFGEFLEVDADGVVSAVDEEDGGGEDYGEPVLKFFDAVDALKFYAAEWRVTGDRVEDDAVTVKVNGVRVEGILHEAGEATVLEECGSFVVSIVEALDGVVGYHCF